jgi:hypothetical protein
MKKNSSPWLIALTNKLNLAMLGLALVAGACSAWWLGLLGILLYLLMVIIVARDPSLKISQTIDGRAPLAQRFQKQFTKIERVQVSIFNAINNADAGYRQVMRPIRNKTDELVAYAHNLCQRMSVLENHRLVSESTTQIKTSISELKFQLDAAQDALVKREYEESLAAAQTRLQSLLDVERQLKRTDAQLHNLTSQLNHTLTEIIRIQALDEVEVKELVPTVIQKLDQQLSELRLFSKEVSQM